MILSKTSGIVKASTRVSRVKFYIQHSTFYNSQSAATPYEGVRLPLHELVHCRVRYFSDGVIIGSKEFIEKMLNEHGVMFSKLRRKRGANQMKSGEWGNLCAACERLWPLPNN